MARPHLGVKSQIMMESLGERWGHMGGVVVCLLMGLSVVQVKVDKGVLGCLGKSRGEGRWMARPMAFVVG